MYWLLAPTVAARSITLVFEVMDTEEGFDFVDVYQCQDPSCGKATLLVSFSGHVLPEPFHSPTSVLLIVWRSDNEITYSGWKGFFLADEVHYEINKQLTYRNAQSTLLQRYGGADQRYAVYFRLKSNEILHKSFAGSRNKSHRSILISEQKNISSLKMQTLPSVFGVKETNWRLMMPSADQILSLHDLIHRSSSLVANPGSRHPSRAVRRIDDALLADSKLCGPGNIALYGSCQASGFQYLEFSQFPGSVFPGLPFTFTVTKKDAYGQTILSDSSSLIQAVPVLDDLTASGRSAADQIGSIVGSTLSKVVLGVSSFEFAIKPMISAIEFHKDIANISGQLSVHVMGSDAQTGLFMISELKPLNMKDGAGMCPAGYILSLDQSNITTIGSAACVFCKPGTYSILPLAHMRGFSDTSPSCISCPAGGDCSDGGRNVHFKVGIWIPVDGIYVLIDCPKAFQLVNSTNGMSHGIFSNSLQQCRACIAGQYIINPNSDSCQTCPPGAS